MSSNGDRGSGIGDQGSGIGDRDDRLNLAIDRAVREMLDVEQPAGLRGRVLDRIDALSTNHVASPTDSVVSAFLGAEASAKAARRKIWWIGAPIAAAAVIVLALLAPWRQTVPQVGPSGSPSIAQVKPAPLPPPMTSQTPQPPRTALNPAPPVTPAIALSGSRPSPRGIEDRLVVAAVAPDVAGTTTIDPLAPIAPITVAAARPQDIAPKEIAISPLAPIAELQIAPLSPPDRRN